MIRVFRDFLVPVLVLGAGIGATQFLFRTAPAEAEAEIVPAPLAVYATTVETVEDLAKVHTTGRVEPARQVIVVPEVGGRLVSLSDELVPGGRFKEGEEIGRFEPREYSMCSFGRIAGHSGRVRTGAGNPKRQSSIPGMVIGESWRGSQ